MKRNIGRIATVVLLSALADAYAATRSWTNTVDGSFQTVGNWNPNTVPGGLDTAEFKQSAASPYTVTLDDHVSVTNVTFPSGVYAMTLDLNGKTLTSASNGVVALGTAAGSAIDLTVKSSVLGGKFNFHQMNFFSSVANAGGTVNITGSNTSVNVTQGSKADNSVFNQTTNGIFTVSDGAHFTISKYVQFAIGAVPFGRTGVASISPKATLIITDTGTTCTNLNAFCLGKAGTNMPTIVVSNGATCKAAGFTIGAGGDTWYSFSRMANGKLVVTGTNSYCETGSVVLSALAGEFGTPGSTAGGHVVVEKGGVLKSTGVVTLSGGLVHYYPVSNINPGSVTNLNAYGEVIVRNPGSKMILATDVQVTAYANGAFHVLDGANVTGGGILYTSLGVLGPSITGTTTNQPAYTNDNAYGLFVVSNANSVATFKRVLFANQAGYGDIVVADNARLSVTNTGTGCDILIKPRCRLTVSDAFAETQTLTTYSNSTIRIVLGARDHASAYIKSTAAVSLNAESKLEIGVLASATLNRGDTVTLLTYTGTRSGTFKDLPEDATILANGRRFKIYYGDGSNDAITLKYVPWGTMIRVL